MQTKIQKKTAPRQSPNPKPLVEDEAKTVEITEAISLKDDPPEGFVPWSEFCEENPKFGKDYRGRIDTHMSMWINEDKGPAFAELLSEYDFERDVTCIREIPVKAAFTIKVTDFLSLMGDPSYMMHKDRAPKELGIDDLHWKNQKRHLIRRWRRETERRPIERFDKDTKTMRILASVYSEIDGKSTCNVDINDKLGLWGNIPQDVWILPPDKMSYTTRAAVDIADFTYEAMRICDISLNKKKYTDEDIEAVRQHLLAKAKDYQIESIITGTSPGALVLALMKGAAEKHKQE